MIRSFYNFKWFCAVLGYYDDFKWIWIILEFLNVKDFCLTIYLKIYSPNSNYSIKSIKLINFKWLEIKIILRLFLMIFE